MKRIIGLTGSDLKDFHVKMIEKLIHGPVIRSNFAHPSKTQLICHHLKVFSKVKDY
jgi:hypothetical protein